MISKSILLLGLVLGADAWAHEAQVSKFTYRKDVLPILDKQCGRCHASGGAGPMSLLRYEEAFPWAASLKLEVLEGRMPPWMPDEDWAKLRGTRALTAREVDTLVDWATGAAPEGNTIVAAIPTKTAQEVLKPDLVLELPRETVLSADDVEKEVCAPLPTNLKAERWVSGIEFLPGNAAIVRSATLTLGPDCDSRARPLLAWTPGSDPWVLPEGVSERLPGRAVLALHVRYRKTWRDDGKECRDRSRLAMRFAKRSVPVEALRVERSPVEMQEDGRVLAVYPVLNKGQRIQVEGVRRDGTRVPLLKIESFDPAWSSKFAPAEPVFLKKGDRIEATSPHLWVEYAQTFRRGKDPSEGQIPLSK